MQRSRGHYLALDRIDLSFPMAVIIASERPHHLLSPPLILFRLANHCPFLLSVGDHVGDKSDSKGAHTGVKLLPINRDGFGATGEE